jgi:hypothetical protein
MVASALALGACGSGDTAADAGAVQDGGSDAGDGGKADAGDGGAADAGCLGTSCCVIDGGTFAAGAANPANPCQGCVPATAATAWSPRGDGTWCGDAGTFTVCGQGVCVAARLVTAQLSSVGNWNSVAMTPDGKHLVAGGAPGPLFTSDDYGATWAERSDAGKHNWSGIAMSSDGQRLAAVGNGDGLYTSGDRGATWAEQAGAGRRDWTAITASATGDRLVAVSFNGPA